MSAKEVLRKFNIPSLEEVELNDQVLLSEFLKTGNQTFLVGVLLRALKKNIKMTEIVKSVSEINDNLIAVLKKHEAKIEEMESRLKDIYTVNSDDMKH